MPPGAYRKLLAATNMKQRTRKLLEYTWADRLCYAVAGTPNLLEYDQGFFVKGGDGLADLKPIAGLYKGQVYALARELGLPESIGCRTPDDRHVQPPADPGGVLLRPSLRADGRADVGPRRGIARGRARAAASGSTEEEVEAAYARDRTPAGRDRVPPRARGAARRRATDRVRDRRHRPARRRAAGRRSDAAADGPRDPPSRPRRLRLVARPWRRPRLRPGWRSSTCPAAGSRWSGRRRRPARLQRRGLQPPRAPRRAEGARRAFETTSDTEVVLRLLEREGLAALDRLNGQFAFAWWQPARRRLTLVRDRFGVRPLHYALLGDGTLVFGSEAKALFASGRSAARPTWPGSTTCSRSGAPRPPRTRVPRASASCPRAGSLVWERGRSSRSGAGGRPSYGAAGAGEVDLEELLRDSVRLRLRADVPVGTYLSGGLDSSLITALAQQETERRLRTFSVAFSDPRYDERAHQEEVARAIGTRHHVVEAGRGEIAEAFRTWSATPRRRWCGPRRCRSSCSPRGARQRHHRGRHRRGRRRALLGLRPVQGGRRCAS